MQFKVVQLKPLSLRHAQLAPHHSPLRRLEEEIAPTIRTPRCSTFKKEDFLAAA
jgi:hypothetical protein